MWNYRLLKKLSNFPICKVNFHQVYNLNEVKLQTWSKHEIENLQLLKKKQFQLLLV